MTGRLPAACVLLVVLSACSGGATLPPPSRLPTASSGIATGTLAISSSAQNATGKTRKPTYVSTSTTFATLWIDAGTTGTRVPCTAIGNTPSCTINWTSTSGSHTFSIALDDGTSVVGGGNILAEGSAVETLVEGTNTLPTMYLNGVPAQVIFRSEQLWTNYESPYCEGTPGYTFGGCYEGSGSVADADGNLLENSPNLDDGGLCLVPSNSVVGATSNTSCLHGYVELGYIAYAVACQPVSDVATFTLVATPTNPGPYGEVSEAQLAAFNLTYPNQASIAVKNFPTYTCDYGDISD